MKALEKTRNEETNLQANSLTDLPVTDEQADETKGGPRDGTELSSFSFTVHQQGTM